MTQKALTGGNSFNGCHENRYYVWKRFLLPQSGFERKLWWNEEEKKQSYMVLYSIEVNTCALFVPPKTSKIPCHFSSKRSFTQT